MIAFDVAPQLMLKKRVFSPENKWFWLLVALVAKIAINVLLLLNTGELDLSNPLIGVCTGDCFAYKTTAENLVNNGVFALYKDAAGTPIPYAGRMPGYDVVFWLLRQVLSLDQTLNAIVFLQVLLSALSTYCLARIVWQLSTNYSLFLVTFVAYLINTYAAVFDAEWVTESFAVSAVIIGFFFLFRNKGAFDLLLAGCFLTWAVFLRQLVAPFLLLGACYLIYKAWAHRYRFGALFVSVCCFSLPFLLADGAWIIRNYVQKKAFIPLVDDIHAGYAYSERFVALMEFVQSWGGDLVHWNPKAEITLFIQNDAAERVTKSYQDINSLPGYIFTSQYNGDSLRKVQKLYAVAESRFESQASRQMADQWVVSALRNYRKSFRAEKPLYYWGVAPLRLLPRFVLHSGTYNISNLPFAEQNIPQKLFKLFYTVHYALALALGLTGCLMVLLRRGFPGELRVLALCVLYVLLVCPLVLRRIEYRYLVVAYPFLVLIACTTGYQLWSWLKHSLPARPMVTR